MALKLAVTDKFHDYLYGSKFEAVTDNNPLTYILTSGKLDATGQRWCPPKTLTSHIEVELTMSMLMVYPGKPLNIQKNTEVLKAISTSVCAYGQEAPYVQSLSLSASADTTVEQEVPPVVGIDSIENNRLEESSAR